MVGTIICEVGTIMCDICTINVRFYLLEIWYPHGYCRTIPYTRYNFIMFRSLFLNQKIYYSAVSSPEQFRNYGFEKAIILIETALGHAYDAFYTETPLFYWAWGFIFRCITCFFTVFVLVFFLVKEWHKHQQMDLIITYILLSGAVFTEIYAVISLTASDVGLLLFKWYLVFRLQIIRDDFVSKQKMWSIQYG